MITVPATESRELVLSFFPQERRSDAAVEDLASLIAKFLAAPDLSARLTAFVEIKDWTASSAPSPMGAGANRFETFLDLMESQSELRTLFHQAVREILSEIRSVELFAEAGLHPREGLWTEALRRLTERILPSAREDTDLGKLINRLYPTSDALDRVIQRTDESFERIAHVLSPAHDASAWVNQKTDLRQALLLLSVHIAGLGLSPVLRARSHQCRIQDSPYYQLQQSTSELVKDTGGNQVLAAWRSQVQGVRQELEFAHETMEDSGVSTALVFDMWTISHALARTESIVDVLFDVEPHETVRAVKRLLDDVLKSHREDLSLRALFQANSELMARKIVERSGKAGQHYIAYTQGEYRAIWKASLGGGVLTVLTAAFKMRITEAHLPPFLEFIAAGTNYAFSFILMQHLHLALATKQPSITAATFAGIVRRSYGKERLDRVAEFVCRITRSQLASAAGNILAVFFGCLVFARLWDWLFSRPYLDISSAEHVYETLNPIASGTVIYAALTGLILWISALAGGWFENFATFNHLPKAIAEHPLGKIFGPERMKKLAGFVDVNVSGWTTCIVLGYLLGFVPAFGKVLGIPLDVRHVTLSTGTLVLAAASLGREWLYRGWFIQTLFGVGVIFALNLGVSFSIAAAVGLKAYGVSRADQLKIMRYTLKTFFKSPRRFLIPPRSRSLDGKRS
jgi:site-specific recombinase